MDAKPPQRRPKRRLRILFGVVLVVSFLGSLGLILFKWPLPSLALAVLLIVVAAVSAAVFAAYFLPNKLSERIKRAIAVGAAAVGLITGLTAVEIREPSPNGPPPDGSPDPEPLTTDLSFDFGGCEGFVLNNALLKSLPDAEHADDLDAEWAYKNGGATANPIGQLTIQGKSDDVVVIRAMSIVDVEIRPLPSDVSKVDPCTPGSGFIEERFFEVTLGEHPRLVQRPGLNIDGETTLPVRPFPYKVSNAEVEVFALQLVGRPCLCSWKLAIDWTTGGRSARTVVDRGLGSIVTYPVRDEKIPYYYIEPGGSKWYPPLPK
jgi:hypothetical protein